MQDQKWFEMQDIRRCRYSKASWVPLRATQKPLEIGDYGHIGYQEEYRGVASVAVPMENRDEANELNWTHVNTNHSHSAWAYEHHYAPSDVYEFPQDESFGIPLALDQSFDGEATRVWHLHQDLVIALELLREGDKWLCPKEGYAEVARLQRGENGKPVVLEIRTEFLLDYLCARNMGLRICRYHSRREIVADASHIDWPENHAVIDKQDERWEGYLSDLAENGGFFDGAASVMVVSRTDVYPEDDIPVFGWPTDGDVQTTQYEHHGNDRKLTMVVGECWLDEWMEPGNYSPRIRRDNVPVSIHFITDEKGTRETRETLVSSRRWLWFKPETICEVSHRRGGQLGWYTRDTGSVGCTRHGKVHFGVNKLGLVNVFAKDIVLLPEWQQRIWAGMNISPDGGVSEELLASQMQCRPASTEAPEILFYRSMTNLNQLFETRLDSKLFREHEDRLDILERTHRFRASSREGLYSLAKDIARVTADSLELDVLRKLVAPPKGEKPWGSLKHLEKFIATLIEPERARALLAHLVGAYELRHGDAHLPGRGINEALVLAGIDESLPPVSQGATLIANCGESLTQIYEILQEKWG